MSESTEMTNQTNPEPEVPEWEHVESEAFPLRRMFTGRSINLPQEFKDLVSKQGAESSWTDDPTIRRAICYYLYLGYHLIVIDGQLNIYNSPITKHDFRLNSWTSPIYLDTLDVETNEPIDESASMSELYEQMGKDRFFSNKSVRYILSRNIVNYRSITINSSGSITILYGENMDKLQEEIERLEEGDKPIEIMDAKYSHEKFYL